MLNKKTRRDDDGVQKPASLCKVRQLNALVIPFALITVAAPAQTTWCVCAFHPAAPRTIQRRRVDKVLTGSLLSGPPLLRLLFLFNAFQMLVYLYQKWKEMSR
jgi:hypothetical protein